MINLNFFNDFEYLILMAFFFKFCVRKSRVIDTVKIMSHIMFSYSRNSYIPT